MLKRNLIIVAVISLSIILTSNVFGQNNKQKRTTTKPKVTTTTSSTPPTNARTTNLSANTTIEPTNTNLTDNEYLDFGIEVKAGNTKPKVATTDNSTPPANAQTAPQFVPDMDSDQSGMVKSPRDSASGQSTGNSTAREAGSGNATGRKGTRKAIEFESTTRPHNDGIVSNLMKGHEGQQERKAVSGNTTGLVNAPLTPVNIAPKPKAKKSMKRKKP